ncbi:S-adenosyl-L-methionine-dependent methyltransferase [Neohortaea acidophila]|uniref:S-adenosyl-L-methionine-dependent methyltransferase n=1 Tax=Neohortaea acidophila TaxID=245834 RepID=A0A6A6PR55_9PEZI|nr:S-adenosyl-L-methionine-dependent methyltransferase [Neohortaea acidophila]KAF2482286.1 S-adenosyl-L-methionine-dependent methyltransferase [Neohortaea acidophila]
MASAVSNLRASGNERFNKEAESWDSRPFVKEASRDAQKVLVEKLQSLNQQTSKAQVLEIGCGTGILSFLMAPHVERIVAIDAAQGMIDVLEKKLKASDAPKNIMPVAVLLEDPEDPQLPPADPAKPDGPRQKFDLILSHLVLHHIPDLEAVLHTMLGCLAPSGRVMLTDFEDFGSEARRFHPESKMDGVARHGIAAAWMAELMEKVGFVNVGVRPEWTMTKTVEKFAGEFGEKGQMQEGQGEKMEFPFVVCYGERAG